MEVEKETYMKKKERKQKSMQNAVDIGKDGRTEKKGDRGKELVS